MANWSKWLSQIFISVIVLLAIEIQLTNGKGARGGGARSSGGSRTSRSGSGSSRTRSTSYRTTRYSGLTWTTAMTAGYLYGSTSYMRRRRYYSDRYAEPSICYSTDYKWNTTMQGYFICPLENDPDDYDYCCGPDYKETCCRYFDDAGRVAGIVIACLIVAAIIGVACFCCIKREYHGRILSRVKTWRGSSSNSTAQTYVVPDPPKPQTHEYPVQPESYVLQPPPYTASPPPAFVNYDSPPGPDGKPPLPEDGRDQGQVPYPINPIQPAGQFTTGSDYAYINPDDVQTYPSQGVYDNRGMSMDHDGPGHDAPPMSQPPPGWTVSGAGYSSDMPPPPPYPKY